MTQGQCQAQVGSIIIFVLAIFIAGCGGGDDAPATEVTPPTTPPPPPPSTSLDTLVLTAKPGTINVVDVGQTVTLDGSDSSVKIDDGSGDPNNFETSGETISHAWSFRSRPFGSNAQLDDPTSVSPSFTADLKGTYTVELVISTRGFDSINIAFVEAVNNSV